jgi:DNA-binding transcriptional LysR family regulator
MRMDIADLRLFLAVADAGSITAGAAQANLALGSASERLRAIEADAGTALLNRHPRGVSLTEAGAALAHHARLILQQQAQLRGEMEAFAQGARGTLHLYANTAALTNYLPSRLAPWLAQRPRLHVELHERTSTEVVRALSAGQAEAGIISDAVPAEGLQRHVVSEDPRPGARSTSSTCWAKPSSRWPMATRCRPTWRNLRVRQADAWTCASA